MYKPNHVYGRLDPFALTGSLEKSEIYTENNDISDLLNPKQANGNAIDSPLILHPPEPSPLNRLREKNKIKKNQDNSTDLHDRLPNHNRPFVQKLENALVIPSSSNDDSTSAAIVSRSHQYKSKSTWNEQHNSKLNPSRYLICNRDRHVTQEKLSSTTCSSSLLAKPEEIKKKSRGRNRNAAIIAGIAKGVFIAITISASFAIYYWRAATIPYVEGVMNFVKDLKWTGVPFFAVMYSLWTTLLLPGEFLVLASGFIFTSSLDCSFGVGLIVANITVFAGLCLGGSTIFLLSKYYFPQKWDKSIRSYDICRAVILAIEDGGIWFLLLFRASPLVPFQISNIILGMSNLSYMQWLVGLLGTFPAMLSSTFIGSQLIEIKEIFEEHNLSNHKGLVQVCCVVLLPSLVCIIVAYILIKSRMDRIKAERGLVGTYQGESLELTRYEAGTRLM